MLFNERKQWGVDSWQRDHGTIFYEITVPSDGYHQHHTRIILHHGLFSTTKDWLFEHYSDQVSCLEIIWPLHHLANASW